MRYEIEDPKRSAWAQPVENFAECLRPLVLITEMMEHGRCDDHVDAVWDHLHQANVLLNRGHEAGGRPHRFLHQVIKYYANLLQELGATDRGPNSSHSSSLGAGNICVEAIAFVKLQVRLSRCCIETGGAETAISNSGRRSVAAASIQSLRAVASNTGFHD